jgi:hypothetical protein
MSRIPQPPSLESKSHNFGDKDPKTVACRLKNNNLKNYENDDTNDGHWIRNPENPLFRAN